MNLFPDIEKIDHQLDDIERDAQALVSGLGEERGVWRAEAGTWSVAECLAHLATTNRLYMTWMKAAAVLAAEQGRTRRGPATPGIVGRWFVNSFEPPVKSFKIKAPSSIRPDVASTLAESSDNFLSSHDEVHSFVEEFSNLDLSHIHFKNPFIGGLRFSLATGLYVIAAHERRHLWQGWNVRRKCEGAEGESR